MGGTVIAAGYGHTCALTATDSVKCWGAQAYDGPPTQRRKATLGLWTAGIAGVTLVRSLLKSS